MKFYFSWQIPFATTRDEFGGEGEARREVVGLRVKRLIQVGQLAIKSMEFVWKLSPLSYRTVKSTATHFRISPLAHSVVHDRDARVLL